MLRIALLFVSLTWLFSCNRQVRQEPISNLTDFEQLYEQFLRYSRDADSAYVMALQLTSVADLSQNDSLKATAFSAMGTAYELRQQYDSARFFFHKSLKKATSDTQLSLIFNGLGGVYYFEGKLDSALHYYQEAVRIIEPTNDARELSKIYSNLGMVCNVSDLNEQAVYYFNAAIREAKKAGIVMQELPALLNLSSLYMKTEVYDSAIHYAEQVRLKSEQNGIPYGKGKAHFILASTYLAMADLPNAGSNLLEASAIFKKVNSERDLLSTQFLSSKVFYEMKLYHKSLDQLAVVEKAAHLNEGLQQEILELKSLNLAAIKDFEGAYEGLKNYYELTLSVIEKNREAKLADLQYQFDTQAKNSQIRQLENESTIALLKLRQKNSLIIAAALALLLLASLGYVLFKNTRIAHQRKISKLETSILRTQLNPHFLFNALGALQQYILTKGNPQAISDYLGQFARLTRHILNYSKEEFIFLSEEIEFIRQYLELQQIRFEHPFEYHITLDPKLNPDEVMIPPMLTQPFVENAIEHGLLHKKDGGLIDIKISETPDNQVEVVVIDNGIGRVQASTVEKRSQHKPIAIGLTKDRLRLLQQSIKKPTRLDIIDLLEGENKSAGTKILLQIPLIRF